ncbi:aminotransferase class IV [Maribellus sp. CM-23]|uniref:aminotransferase class IV n=1 Tax=Maribellus sp. CM-23 TaxID=2781026 RepID=UPI001F2D4775|nr:aminotransferase class IV [Maribellus sp. CM-23]MCE4565353.1 aminotransferase class IV [Maribellus sp. CM-23]
MALSPIHKFFILNGELKTNDQFQPAENEGGVYEVIRIVDGKPLFLEEHLARFKRSAEIAGREIQYSETDISSYLQDLIRQNKVYNGNVLVSCKVNLKAFFIAHSYPTKEQYQWGVECGLLHAERENPNAKVFQTTVRGRANQIMAEKGYYEVLLVDHDGNITEGSRSNAFFIKGSQLITPPSEKVLLGVTRQKVIQCARGLGIDVKEQEVSLTRLAGFNAVFITGTSPNILPVSKIGETDFDEQNPLLRKLMKQFDVCIEQYLQDY